MPKLRLTTAAVARLQPAPSGQVEYYDTHLPAFGMRVSYSGTKAWFVMTGWMGSSPASRSGRRPGMSLAKHETKLE
jgi:hypothetical protein